MEIVVGNYGAYPNVFVFLCFEEPYEINRASNLLPQVYILYIQNVARELRMFVNP
jgi:hypothetical protein